MVKFVTGIDGVSLDSRTCQLAWYNSVYEPFHKGSILANTWRCFNKVMVETQTMLYHINLGHNPYPSSTDSNVVGGRKINKDKFFWKALVAKLKEDRLAIGNCLHQLLAYDCTWRPW